MKEADDGPPFELAELNGWRLCSGHRDDRQQEDQADQKKCVLCRCDDQQQGAQGDRADPQGFVGRHHAAPRRRRREAVDPAFHQEVVGPEGQAAQEAQDDPQSRGVRQVKSPNRSGRQGRGQDECEAKSKAADERPAQGGSEKRAKKPSRCDDGDDGRASAVGRQLERDQGVKGTGADREKRHGGKEAARVPSVNKVTSWPRISHLAVARRIRWRQGVRQRPGETQSAPCHPDSSRSAGHRSCRPGSRPP